MTLQSVYINIFEGFTVQTYKLQSEEEVCFDSREATTKRGGRLVRLKPKVILLN